MSNSFFLNKFLFSFKAITILYVIAFITYAIIYFLESNIVNESRIPIFNHLLKNINIDFPFWVYILFWSFNIAVFIIPIYLLIFCFSNNNYTFLFLHSKKAAILFYFFLLFFSAVIFFITYTSLVDSFFYANNQSALDEVVNFLYPKTASELQKAFYIKIEAVLLFFIACCNTFFCLFFWKAYKKNNNQALSSANEFL